MYFAVVFRYHQSYLASLFQMEFLRKTFHMKISLILNNENKPVGGTLFHKNGFENSEMA